MSENPSWMEEFDIEPLTDDCLELVAGGKSSDSPYCCSCRNCSDGDPDGGTCHGSCDGGTGGPIIIEIPFEN